MAKLELLLMVLITKTFEGLQSAHPKGELWWVGVGVEKDKSRKATWPVGLGSRGG